MSYTDNASANATGLLHRNVYINLNVSVLLPVEAGTDANGIPIYTTEYATLDVILWHELIGHASKGKKHPEKPWNDYHNWNSNPLPRNWGRVDPTIVIENEARAYLGLPARRPQYYDGI